MKRALCCRQHDRALLRLQPRLQQRRPPLGEVSLRDGDLSVDLALLNGPEDRMTLVSTEPLTHSEAWQPFEAGEVRVFEQGDCVYASAGVAVRAAA